jgi:hypothetical protein
MMDLQSLCQLHEVPYKTALRILLSDEGSALERREHAGQAVVEPVPAESQPASRRAAYVARPAGRAVPAMPAFAASFGAAPASATAASAAPSAVAAAPAAPAASADVPRSGQG